MLQEVAQRKSRTTGMRVNKCATNSAERVPLILQSVPLILQSVPLKMRLGGGGCALAHAPADPGRTRTGGRMKTYGLVGPRPADPAWFRRVQHDNHPAVVGEDGTVELDGVALRFRDDVLPVNTAVIVWLERNFVCARTDDIAAQQAARQAAEVQARETQRERRNRKRQEAEAFNAELKLPVRWDVGFKSVRSGLLAHSAGDGRNRASVNHIVVLEDLSAGRLKRNAGDFLCTQRGTSNGRERVADGDGNEYPPAVTCQACLRMAQRWREEERDGGKDQTECD